MSLQFMERHPAIRICRTCSERRGSRRRQPLVELQIMKEMSEKKNDEDVKIEREKKMEKVK